MAEVFTVLVGRSTDTPLHVFADGSYELSGSTYCSVLMESGPATTRRLLRLGTWTPAPPPPKNCRLCRSRPGQCGCRLGGMAGPFNKVRERQPEALGVTESGAGAALEAGSAPNKAEKFVTKDATTLSAIDMCDDALLTHPRQFDAP